MHEFIERVSESIARSTFPGVCIQPRKTVRTGERRKLEVAEAALLDLDEVVSADVRQGLAPDPLLCLVQLRQLVQEPGVDVGVLKDLVQAHAVIHGLQVDSLMMDDNQQLHVEYMVPATVHHAG